MARLIPAMDDVDAHVILAEDGPLAERLRRDGVSVEVLPMREEARGVTLDRLTPGRLPLASVGHSSAYAARLAGRLRRLRPDLVHTNSMKAAIYGALGARMARVPVLWHLHDRIASDYMPAPAVSAVRLASRILPDAIIANSRATLATVEPLSRPAAVIPCAVDLGLARAPSRPPGPLAVGMVGRIAPWKGQDVFLRGFAEAFPDGEARATIVGAPLFGEEAYERELHELAARLGVSERVRFAGFRDDVAAELAELDVLVHASVIPEPFGQVVVEGMAAGIPVIAAGSGGPAEVMDDEVHGLLYAPRDSAALAGALRRLAGAPELRVRMGQAGLERARRFAPARVAAEVRAVYRRLLSR
jgi:glycosyltransferase involved in cell wall biosynthesis